MTTERRQSSPEYRERVGQLAQITTAWADHDYEEAAATAKRMHENEWHKGNYSASQTWHDVASLLRRRAETVKGMRV